MDDETSLFSRQFTGNTSLYFFLHQYRQKPLYLSRNLNYLHEKVTSPITSSLIQVQKRRKLGSFIFEKEIYVKNAAVWRIYMSFLKIPSRMKKWEFPASFSFSATLFIYRLDGQCLYQKSIYGNGTIDMLDNLLFFMEEPFKIPCSVFRRTKGGITINRVCKGQLVFTINDNDSIFMPGIREVIDESKNVYKGLLNSLNLEIMKKGSFLYITFSIPWDKTSDSFDVLYFSKNGNHHKTDYILNMCFIGEVFQDTKLDLNSKISLRSKLMAKHLAPNSEEKAKISYVYKAEENNETVVRTSTRKDFQCPWCRGKDFHTRQRLHFHFLMNHELFSFKLEINQPGFFQFEIKLANEYPSKRISEQKVDFRVFQWIRHAKFKHNVENILSDNGKSILFRNIILGMDVEQNESVPVNMKLKRKTQLRWPSEKRIRRKFAAPNMNNLYRSVSKRKIIPGEILSESEDDIDETWLIQKHEDTLDDFMDITAPEKAFMKLWNKFIMKDRPIGRCHLPDSIMRFVYSHKNILQTENLVSEFWKHLLNLVQYKIIDLVTLRKSMEVVRNIHNEITSN
ncbi:hypothetical protein PORY_001156 [Pneumocystis oryctolagi]|uniref:Uncharacterized protein n=1 Tax=Pneumocystis oryctolagi TaxID=42067 RepID=A0ACB7CDN1_9ASCO|nr:hypothetical protein PORY_001156 [Pneumocystis oryctolagi]